MDICENVQLPPEPEEDEVGADPNALPVHVPLSARSWNYNSTAEREISAVAVAVPNTTWPHPGEETEVPMAFAVPVAEEISDYHPCHGENPPSVAGSERHAWIPRSTLAPIPERRETSNGWEDSNTSDEQSSMELATQNPPTNLEDAHDSAGAVTDQACDAARSVEAKCAHQLQEERVVAGDMESTRNDGTSVDGKTTARGPKTVLHDSTGRPLEDDDSGSERSVAAVEPRYVRRASSKKHQEDNRQKPERRNVAVCGTSIKTMKGSRATSTTFSLGDLAVPGNLKKKKRKKG